MNLEENIKRMKAELALMEAKLEESKKDKWKLPENKDGSEYVITGDGIINKNIDKDYTKAGRRRATKELAEICAKNSKQRDLLESYAHHIDPDWRDRGAGYVAYYLYKNINEKYNLRFHSQIRNLGTVYMRKETAEQICKALNDGLITL